MRGKGPKHIAAQTRIPGEVTAERERLERGWFRRLTRVPSWAGLVTAADNRLEPFHRWLVFKQAYSPRLVRRFVETEFPEGEQRSDLVLLDPFAGTGTLPVECARLGVRAVGVEPTRSMAFVTSVKFSSQMPPMPDIGDCTDWSTVADRLTRPIHRAALICAVASRYTSRGTLNKSADPLATAIGKVSDMIAEDLLRPLPMRNRIVCADSRELAFLADESIDGVVTSPPYLSRHDYAKLSEAIDEVYAHWYSVGELTEKRRSQLPASPRARGASDRMTIHPAAKEAVETLRTIGQKKLAGVVGDYFRGLAGVLGELLRVMKPGAACWMIVAGARLKDVYVPSDTILADMTGDAGFSVERVLAVRDVISSGRKFGALANVRPRESIIVLRR